MFPETIETDRLRLDAVTSEHPDPLDLYGHIRVGAPHIEEITRHLTWEPHETPKVTRDFLDDCAASFEEGEGATYVLYPREGEDGAGEIAGLAGLAPDWERRLATLGTWLRKPFWGRGYSGERAHALMRVAFERLDLDCVVVTCDADNEKSRRAITKYVEAAGGREEGLLRTFVRMPDGPRDSYRFTVTREEWAESGP